MSNELLLPDEVIRSAAQMLADGAMHEAQELLLVEGYIKRLEPSIQEAYLRMIPIGPVLGEMLGEAYPGLSDPDPRIRSKSITSLLREFAKEKLRGNTRWMRDPRASEPIIEAVKDDDRKVAQRALRALSRLVCRYFPDQRTLPTFVSMLSHRKQEVRVDAISGVGCLRREDALKHLVPLIEHGTDEDRTAVSGQIWGLSLETFQHTYQYPIEWTDDGRRFWRTKMESALSDSAVSVRKQSARALRQLGEDASLPALRAAREAESDEDARFYIDDAITAIRGRGQYSHLTRYPK
jgi:hypothetical protein